MPSYIISMSFSVLFDLLKEKDYINRYRRQLLKLREVLNGLELG